MSAVLEAPRATAPTHSSEAEYSVLGAMLIDPACIDRVGAVLTLESFHDQAHRLCFSAIVSLSARGKPVDVVTVFDELDGAGQAEAVGGLEYLNAIAQSVPSAANVDRYAAIVSERAMLRGLLAALDGAAEIARLPGAVTEKIDAAQVMLSSLTMTGGRKKPRRMSEIALERTELYEALEAGKGERGWSTGFHRLDQLLAGGLRPGRLYIVAARPGVGKSSFSMSIAIKQAQRDRPALFLSQEMECGEIADRAVSSTGAIGYGNLQTGKMGDDGWRRANDAIEALAALELWIDDQGSLTLFDIRAKARSIKGLKVLVVDYLQLCASGLKEENRNAQIEELSRGLKALAKELGIAIVALSQLNREVEKRSSKRPQLSDLRDSGAIEQDADAVLFLWPLRPDETAGARSIGLEVAKQRNGQIGTIVMTFDGAVQTWTETSATLEEHTPSRPSRGGYD